MDMKQIIDHFGSKAALAKAAGVTRQAVTQWVHIPAERVLAIEAATGHRVSRHELRPDLYPKESWCRCPACRLEAGEGGSNAA